MYIITAMVVVCRKPVSTMDINMDMEMDSGTISGRHAHMDMDIDIGMDTARAWAQT
jgi:hypothetical protein